MAWKEEYVREQFKVLRAFNLDAHVQYWQRVEDLARKLAGLYNNSRPLSLIALTHYRPGKLDVVSAYCMAYWKMDASPADAYVDYLYGRMIKYDPRTESAYLYDDVFGPKSFENAILDGLTDPDYSLDKLEEAWDL